MEQDPCEKEKENTGTTQNVAMEQTTPAVMPARISQHRPCRSPTPSARRIGTLELSSTATLQRHGDVFGRRVTATGNCSCCEQLLKQLISCEINNFEDKKQYQMALQRESTLHMRFNRGKTRSRALNENFYIYLLNILPNVLLELALAQAQIRLLKKEVLALKSKSQAPVFRAQRSLQLSQSIASKYQPT